MSDPVDLAPPPADCATVAVRVSLIEDVDSVTRVAQAIAAAGGRLRTLATVRSVPEVNAVELALCIQDLDHRAVALALGTVAGILTVAPASGAPILERRSIRIAGRVRWPGSARAIPRLNR
jgi:hypothetical protein